ncbi:uncharacterized protein LOC109810614 [Cajanus cajan]|uniref:uncharacterized protein LOC109810614 n=1 Tax=Cajanus cajan TaxID=3821 RepID=UPI00098DA6BB|nr:uncharacterized protein LOC109810614 [Cajanus cajan]
MMEPFRSTYASRGIYLLQGPPSQNVGVCRFFGITRAIPLFCMDFSAAPFCFMYLHSAMFLRSMFNSLFLLRGETIVSETIEVNDGQQKMIVVANGDEFSIAMTRKNENYDMDSEDEKWLRKFNKKSLRVSNENFELIVDALEKAFHFNPDGCVDAKSAANQCPQDLGTKDVLKAVSRYWMKKRKQKLTPPIRVIQNSEPETAPPIRQHLLRKRRSLRRPIRYGGGKYRGAWQDKGVNCELVNFSLTFDPPTLMVRQCASSCLKLRTLIVDKLAGLGNPVLLEEHVDTILEGLSQDYALVISVKESKFLTPVVEVEAILLAHES